MLSPALRESIRSAMAGASTSGDFGTLLGVVLRRFGADLGMLHRLNPAEGHLELVATSDGVPEPVLAASRRIPLGKGIAGATAQSGKPVSLCNLQTDASGVVRPGAKTTGSQGALCVPVFLGEEIVGTLGVGVRGERTFTEAEIGELLAIGREVAGPLAGRQA